jgi:hypothetical protein
MSYYVPACYRGLNELNKIKEENNSSIYQKNPRFERIESKHSPEK